jgi:Fibronectin type III domain
MMYGPGGQRPANPGGRQVWPRGPAVACLAAALLTGTLAFTFAPGGSLLLDQGNQPGPPTNLAATADGSSEVTLSWGPPTLDGGAAIILYDVVEGTSFLGEVHAPNTSYTVAVTSGTTYTFQVSAINGDKQQGPAAAVTYPASSQTTPPPSSQTITFGPLTSRPVNAQFTVSATATSGLAVRFSSSTPAVCTVSDSTAFDQAEVMTLTAGTCTIVAAQGGNADYALASDVTRSFQIGSVTSAASLPLLIIVAAAVILAAAAALLVRRRRLRSRPRPAPEPDVRAVPHAGPPVVVHVQATRTGATHTLRIEPHPGAGITTIEKSRP